MTPRFPLGLDDLELWLDLDDLDLAAVCRPPDGFLLELGGLNRLSSLLSSSMMESAASSESDL